MASLNNDGQLAALWMVRGWAMANDTRHGGAFHGSMVVPDSRINSSVNPVSGGAIMDGTLTCTGVEPASIVTSGNPIHNISISIGSWVYVAQPDMRLAVSQIKWDEVATTRCLWFSNTAGVLPNATKVNSTYYVTECQHTLSMTSVSPSATIQTINPAVAIVEGCNSMNTDDCVADSVSKTILSWWGGIGQSFWGLNCRGGVLGHLEALSEDGIMEAPCKLTTDLWRETAASVLDAIMQTVATESLTNQTLVARVESIDVRTWWLQALVPALTVLLYALSVMYTCFLSGGEVAKVKEINLAEIIDAAVD